MSSENFWGSVSLHVENLVPGLATGGLALLLARGDFAKDLAEAGVLGAASFVSSCYIVGAFTNVVARLVLDNLSDAFVRWRALRLWASDKDRMKAVMAKGKDEINREYSTTLTLGLLCPQSRIADEVVHRRGTGRILRSGWVPALLAACLLYHALSPWWLALIAIALAWVALTLLWLVVYAFAEVTIYREAYRAHPRPEGGADA